MSKNRQGDERDHGGMAAEANFSADGRTGVEGLPEGPIGGLRLRVRTIERTAIVRFEDAEVLFEESAVHVVGQQLHRLIEEGHTRLVVNFRGVQYLSSEVLGILAGLQRKVEQARGRIQLCGLDPLLREMVRITHLDRVFDIYGDEAEALGLMLRT
jgi:anti-sigma B factor antagonist